VTTAVATAVAFLALAAFLALGGYDAGRALGALWTGSLGSSYALLSGTLVRATPLVLAGLAVTLAFRAGVLNVGAEGQLLAGAAAAAAAGVAWGPALGRLTLLPALAGGAAAGALWAAGPAWLRRRRGVLEVISTIMMNFVALYAVGWLVRGPMQEPLRIYPQSAELPAAARLPRLDALLPGVPPGTRLHAGFVLALLAAVALWWVLRSTATGFRVRAAGASPDAAASAGLIDVGRTTAVAFLASGALAGLAGAVEVAGVTYALYENISPGYGYTAIAVALLARLHPLAVVLAGVAFGALEAGAGAMQRDAAVPSVVVSAVEASAILAVLAAGRLGALRGLTRQLTPAETAGRG
ncbi:MAG TPA: ABC transporter permease, partial [Gemmatimonadaceae bacterium]|nr:ABC transporter permease [Gemmatimonadaceae bacterium]